MWFARCASGASLGGLAPAGHASRHRRRPGSGRAPLRRRVPDREPASKRGVPAFRSIAAADDSAGADEDDAFPSGEDASPRWRVRRADASDADAVVRLAAAAGVEWSAAQVTEEVEKGNALVAVSAGNDARDDACADADGPRVSPSSSSAREDADDADAVVAGFIVAWVVADVEVQILEVATRPSMRRRGVASALVRAALDLAAAEARLECRAKRGGAPPVRRARVYGNRRAKAVLRRRRGRRAPDPRRARGERARTDAPARRALPRGGARARAPHPRGEAEGRRHARAGLPARQAGVCAQPRRSATRSERRAARVPHAEQDTQVSGLRVAVVSRVLL